MDKVKEDSRELDWIIDKCEIVFEEVLFDLKKEEFTKEFLEHRMFRGNIPSHMLNKIKALDGYEYQKTFEYKGWNMKFNRESSFKGNNKFRVVMNNTPELISKGFPPDRYTTWQLNPNTREPVELSDEEQAKLDAKLQIIKNNEK